MEGSLIRIAVRNDQAGTISASVPGTTTVGELKYTSIRAGTNRQHLAPQTHDSLHLSVGAKILGDETVSLQSLGIREGAEIECNAGLEGGWGRLEPQLALLASYYRTNVKFCNKCHSSSIMSARRCRKCGANKFRKLFMKHMSDGRAPGQSTPIKQLRGPIISLLK